MTEVKLEPATNASVHARKTQFAMALFMYVVASNNTAFKSLRTVTAQLIQKIWHGRPVPCPLTQKLKKPWIAWRAEFRHDLTVPHGTTVPLPFSVHWTAGPTWDRTENRKSPKPQTEGRTEGNRSGLVRSRIENCTPLSVCKVASSSQGPYTHFPTKNFDPRGMFNDQSCFHGFHKGADALEESNNLMDLARW